MIESIQLTRSDIVIRNLGDEVCLQFLPRDSLMEILQTTVLRTSLTMYVVASETSTMFYIFI